MLTIAYCIKTMGQCKQILEGAKELLLKFDIRITFPVRVEVDPSISSLDKDGTVKFKDEAGIVVLASEKYCRLETVAHELLHMYQMLYNSYPILEQYSPEVFETAELFEQEWPKRSFLMETEAYYLTYSLQPPKTKWRFVPKFMLKWFRNRWIELSNEFDIDFDRILPPYAYIAAQFQALLLTKQKSLKEVLK